jgi:hypothetical protein
MDMKQMIIQTVQELVEDESVHKLVIVPKTEMLLMVSKRFKADQKVTMEIIITILSFIITELH